MGVCLIKNLLLLMLWLFLIKKKQDYVALPHFGPVSGITPINVTSMFVGIRDDCGSGVV